MARQQTGTKIVQNADGSHSRVAVYETTPERVTFSRIQPHPAGLFGDETVNLRAAKIDGVFVGNLYGLDRSPYHGSPTRYAFVPDGSTEVAFTSSRLSEARADIERHVDRKRDTQ